MFASRFFLSFLAVTAIAVSASPVEIESRSTDASNVLGVISTLQGKTSSILPQINNLVATKKATAASVTPLVAQLVTALNGASGSFHALSPVSASAATQQQVANAFAPIVEDIAIALAGVEEIVPGLLGLLGGLLGGIAIDVDFALNEVILGLDIVVVGVTQLLSGLLFDVAGLLQGLAFTLTILALGL